MSETIDTPAPAATPAATAATPPSPPAAGAPPPASAPAAPAPSPAATLLAKGAAAAPSPAPAADDPHAWIPAKHRVMKEDGSLDMEASARKVAEAHGHLEKRLGTGDAPPKSADEYAPELPAGVTVEQLKTDPMYAGFLKAAHAKGITNGQMSWMLGEFGERMKLVEQSKTFTPEVAEAELRKEWKTDEQMDRGLADAFRASKEFGGDRVEKLHAKFGNDPDFLWLMAKVGRELGEDTPANEPLSPMEQASLQSLMKSPAYMEAKHPDHEKVVAQVKAAYQRKAGGA